MPKTTFSEWFSNTLAERGLSQADFVRLSEAAGMKMDSAVVSNLINGKRNAGPETCKAISRILKIPLDGVLIAAGIKPEDPQRNDIVEGTVEIMKDMDLDQQREIYEYAKLRHSLSIKKKEHRTSAKRVRPPRAHV